MSANNGGYEPMLERRADALVRGESSASIEVIEDVVQFIESVVVARSDEGELEVGVMRIGKCVGACSCTWRTEEGSAVAGKQFVHAGGTITMKDGENSASVSVPILCDSHWNATKEFRILIENPENCTLGLYLKVVRVKMIDANYFPSNDFRGMELQDMNEFALFDGFLKLMWHRDGVPWRTIICIIIGFMHNLYEYMSLILSVYVVDKVFNFEDDADTLYIPGSRLYTAYVIALALFLPRLFFYFADLLENWMDLSGKLTSEMCKSLFRKFMNYSTKSREDIALSDMVNALVSDVGRVSHGYTRALHMLKSAGSVAIAIFFTLQQNPGAWWAVVAVPTIMACWAKLRTRVFIAASEEADEKESHLLDFSNMALSKMTVIGAYRQRPQMNDLFAKRVSTLTDVNRVCNRVTLNNEAVPKLMGPTLVAVYSLVGATLVIEKELGLGTYLATISVFGSICNNFAEFYGVAMSIISTFPTLKGLTEMLNMETELPDMQAAAKKTAVKTKEKRAAMPEGDIPRVDRMEIEVCNVSFWYEDVVGKHIFRNLNFSAPQGQIIALKSKSGAGRKTLLDLLAGTIYPTGDSGGSIFIPSHLRTLLISREIVILDLSIWENLTFGNKAGNNPHRVEKILRYFDVKPILEDKQFLRDLQKRKAEFDGQSEEPEAEEEEECAKTNPMMKYRETEQALIHLIRGFIMNPEVMLMHRPFVHFHSPEIEELVERALKEQRDNRGFMMSPKSIMTRRPRTCFMSFDGSSKHERMADIVWELPSHLGDPGKQYAPDEKLMSPHSPEHARPLSTEPLLTDIHDVTPRNVVRMPVIPPPPQPTWGGYVHQSPARLETSLEAILNTSTPDAGSNLQTAPQSGYLQQGSSDYAVPTSTGIDRWDL